MWEVNEQMIHTFHFYTAFIEAIGFKSKTSVVLAVKIITLSGDTSTFSGNTVSIFVYKLIALYHLAFGFLISRHTNWVFHLIEWYLVHERCFLSMEHVFYGSNGSLIIWINDGAGVSQNLVRRCQHLTESMRYLISGIYLFPDTENRYASSYWKIFVTRIFE